MTLAVSVHIKRLINILIKSTGRIYIPSDLIHTKYFKSLQRIGYE